MMCELEDCFAAICHSARYSSGPKKRDIVLSIPTARTADGSRSFARQNASTPFHLLTPSGRMLSV
jgi:hypothetical protein